MMQILDLIRQRTAPAVEPQKPGRHSTVGLVDRLAKELADLRESRAKEIEGYQQALQRAAKEVQENAKYRAWFHKADAGWKAADAEVQRLTRLLGAGAKLPAAEAQAPADVDGSCFTEADPAPVTDGPRAVADTPVVAETYEPADPKAETQQTDVATLRDAMGMGRTATLPVVSRVEPVPPAPWVIPAGPGDCKPTELSEATGRRATVRVADAMNEAS